MIHEVVTVGNYEALFGGVVRVGEVRAIKIMWRRAGQKSWEYPSPAGKLFVGEVLTRIQRNDLMGRKFCTGADTISVDQATYVPPPLH